ncbi:hypothetical protein [Sorangium sp. So ce693]|uniref:hypothetical protein n=1 Tax=Sorangium sp. So ce693 TaxID=3133318 RepID=UPI003F624E7D
MRTLDEEHVGHVSQPCEWIRALRLGDFDLVGHSFGGSIAMCVATERPGRIHRVGLVAAGGIGTEVALPLRLAAVTGLIEMAAPMLMGVGCRATPPS